MYLDDVLAGIVANSTEKETFAICFLLGVNKLNHRTEVKYASHLFARANLF